MQPYNDIADTQKFIFYQYQQKLTKLRMCITKDKQITSQFTLF